MNTNVIVIGLTRLGIKPKFTAPEANALTTRPSELLNGIIRKAVKLWNNLEKNIKELFFNKFRIEYKNLLMEVYFLAAVHYGFTL